MCEVIMKPLKHACGKTRANNNYNIYNIFSFHKGSTAKESYLFIYVHTNNKKEYGLKPLATSPSS